MGNVIARQRLFLNADKTKLVAEGDAEGAFLYVAPGDEIPEDAHDLFGLEDGALPGFDPVDPGEIDDKVPSMAPPPGPKEKAAVREAKRQAAAQAKAEKGAVQTKEAGAGKNKEAPAGSDKSEGGAGGAGAGEGGGAGGAGDGAQGQ